MIVLWRSAAFAVCMSLVGSAAIAESSPDTIDPYFGDGGTSEFYHWSGNIAGPGQMLRQEAVGEGFYAEHASLALRILYSSTDGRFGRGVVEASGLLYLPQGEPPDGGWPLVVWGHGTFGIADVCAPSWKRPTARDGTYVDSWLQQGFAVVAPDYQGLGTRGVHPYLQQRPEGYSVLDSARAALAAYPGVIANKVILTGQSQGSGAVLNAATLAGEYAPDVNLLGVIATALVWRGSDEPQIEDITGDDAARYLVMRMMGGGLKEGSPAPVQLLTDKGRLLSDAAANSCSRDLVPVALENGVTGRNAFSLAPERMASLIGSLAVPPEPISVPVLVGTGMADSLIIPSAQYGAVRVMCQAGTRLQWHLYAGITHSGSSNFALPDALDFARQVLRGETPTSGCDAIYPPGPLEAPMPGVPFND